MSAPHRPALTVVIPTYNRCGLLDATLRQFTRQTVPAADFEVVVADDGSSDATEQVTRSYADRLAIGYHYQEDLGFRAGAARNAGARLARAPIVAFLDSGCLPGPAYVEEHLRIHHESTTPQAVLGYVHGYDPMETRTSLQELLDRQPPEEVVAALAQDPSFVDLRNETLTGYGFDLTRLAVPWTLYFSGNCSVPVADFHAVGGFDESFEGWGSEDMELGLRLFERGLRFRAAPEAWVIESPHERDALGNVLTFLRNIDQLLAKHPRPDVEIAWANLVVEDADMFASEADCRQLAEHTDKVRGMDVGTEIAAVLDRLPAGEQVAVFGAGQVADALTERIPVGRLLDFDAALLGGREGSGLGGGRHALGIRTQLAEQSVDTVIVTSRLAGLWGRWRELIVAEAARVGRQVVVFDGG
jgi:glycosyltransferase involved in cell wall biosynthesis